MKLTEIQKNKIITECKFSASRSSGPGGQNVNKVSTKVELRFVIENSEVFTDQEKITIQNKLSNRINSEGELLITASTERTQLKNKEKVIERFIDMLEKALTPQRKRIKTKPTVSSKLKRLESKKLQGKKKQMRKRLDF